MLPIFRCYLDDRAKVWRTVNCGVETVLDWVVVMLLFRIVGVFLWITTVVLKGVPITYQPLVRLLFLRVSVLTCIWDFENEWISPFQAQCKP